MVLQADASPAATLNLFARLEEIALAPYDRVDSCTHAIVTLLAEILDVGLIFLSRIVNETLTIVTTHDRAAMGLQTGDIIPLSDSYCQTLLTRASLALVVPDARTDADFAALRITRTLGIGAYSGVALHRSDGALYGTLCALSPNARVAAPGETALLAVAGRIIMSAIEADESQEREQQMRSSIAEAERMHTLFGAIACGVVVIDAHGEVVDANAAARTLLGLTHDSHHEASWAAPDALMLREDETFLPPEERPAMMALRTGTAQRNIELGFMQPQEGQIRWLLTDAVPVHNSDGTLTHVVESHLDVTDRKRARLQLQHQATHDALTDLPNRRLLNERFNAALQADALTHNGVALLLLDPNRFKEINDTFGHHLGDRVLQQVAERLRETLRGADVVARFGGDEFVVLLPATDEAGALHVAQTILNVLDAPLMVGEHAFLVSGSIGMVRSPTHGTDAETLLSHADVAMYAAKKAGSGFASYDASADLNSPDRLALVADLRIAIDNGDLAVHYQPQANLDSGEVYGVEALVRWTHPQRGSIPPDQFIPLAEQTGLITRITHWVLETTLRACRQWREHGYDLTVSVNLSPWDVHDPLLPDTVATLLAQYAIAPDHLRLELTEREFMSEATLSHTVLERLRALGVGLAIDDFGTGYSSLAYLKRLPADELKVDQSFVREMIADKRDAAIVRAIIDLGRNVGMRVVAEGVEDAASWQQLLALGCTVAQGYYLSQPLTAEAFIHWLGARDQPRTYAVGY